MIIPLPFIVSLLFTITYATDFEYKIDLARCSEDMTCFVKKSCFNPKAGETDEANGKILQRLINPTTLKEAGVCDAIIQVKAFSDEKYLFLMQITAANGLDEAKGIVIQHADAERIACKKVNEEIVHTLTPVPDATVDFFDFEGTASSVFGESMLFCSLFVTSKTNKAIFKSFSAFKDTFPMLKYTQNGEEKTVEYKKIKSINRNDPADIKYSGQGEQFWELPMKISWCMTKSVKTSDETNDDYVLKKVDLTLPSIKCSQGNLMIKNDDGTESHGIDEISCVKSEDENDESYSWSPGLDSSGTVACVMTRFCSACDDTPPSSPEDCPQDICTATPTIGKDTTGCQTLTCPSTENEFTFDGKSSSKSEGTITCKKSASDPTKGGWFFKGDEDAVPAEHSKIACAAIRDCDHSQFDFKCPSDMTCEENKPDYDGAKFNFTCKNGYLQKADGKGEALATVCDRKTGKWQNLEDNANIVCAQGKKDESSEKKEGESTSSAGAGMYVGIVGGILAIAAIGAILYYMLVFKKKQEAKKTTKKEEGTSKKSSKKVESKSGAAGSSNEAKKEEKKSDPNKESEKPAAEAAKEAPKDGKEAPKEGAEAAKEPPKDAAATPAAAATPGAPPTPAAPATPAADSAPAPADATPV